MFNFSLGIERGVQELFRENYKTLSREDIEEFNIYLNSVCQVDQFGYGQKLNAVDIDEIDLTILDDVDKEIIKKYLPVNI